jgi:hypothetical protein
MHRPVGEVVDSQWKMLANRGIAPQSERESLLATQEKHVAGLLEILRRSPRVRLLEIDYPTLVRTPESELSRLLEFLGPALHGDLQSLAKVIKPGLYRNRH